MQFLIHDTGGYDTGVMVSQGQIFGRTTTRLKSNEASCVIRACTDLSYLCRLIAGPAWADCTLIYKASSKTLNTPHLKVSKGP